MQKLYYPMCEFEAAKAEAEKEIADCLRDAGQFFPEAKIEVRIAWREDMGYTEGVMLPSMIPEADLLFNGELVKHDMLDFIILDLLALEMKIMSRKGVSEIWSSS